MPMIELTTHIAAPAADIWDAVRDVGALHSRLVPGFVTATRMMEEDGAPVRRVTFASGRVVDELIVASDDARQRLVWSIRGVQHHNGAMQVSGAGNRATVTWTADVLPASLAEQFEPMMAAGLATMKRHLESGGAGVG